MGRPEYKSIGTGTNTQYQDGNTTSDGQNHNNKSKSSSIRWKQGERENTIGNTRRKIVNTETTSTANKDGK